MLLVLWSALAFGADVVLYSSGVPTEVIERVSIATHTPPEEFRALTLPELASGKAPVLLDGAGAVLNCESAPTVLKDVTIAIDTLQNAVGYMDAERAARAFDSGQSAIRCLAEPLDPALGARLHYLRGHARHGDGATEAEVEYDFGRALHYMPELKWDEYFPPQAKPVFEAAHSSRQHLELFHLTVSPPLTKLRIDGHDVQAPFSLSRGWHIVQVHPPHVFTVEVNLKEPSLLFLPQSIQVDAVNWVTEEARRAELDRVLQALVDDGETVFVVSGGAVWRTEVGLNSWESLKMPVRFTDRRAQAAWGTASLVAGIGGAAIGLGLAVGGAAQANRLASVRDEADELEEAALAVSKHTGALSRYRAGLWIAGGASVVASVGVAVRFWPVNTDK
jgi:hypothetical protein